MSGDIAQTNDRTRHLLVHYAGEGGVQGCEELGLREAVLGRPDRLVPGGAIVARLDAGQLPDHPVGCLDQTIGGAVDLGRLAQYLQGLWEEPLRRDLAAVTSQPGLAHLGRDAIDVVRSEEHT